MKRFILQRFGMRTPLTLQQLIEAVFDAYTRINWKTVAILTLSAKFRVIACIERNGGFIGDVIGECCRRARVEIETGSDIILLSVPFVLMNLPQMLHPRSILSEVFKKMRPQGSLHCRLFVLDSEGFILH